MKIDITRRIRGADLEREILERFGSLAEMRKRIRTGERDTELAEAYFHLDLLQKDPGRRNDTFTLGVGLALGTEDLQRLTPKRLAVLRAIAAADGTTIAELTARLARDQKRVSRDVALLEELGLVRAERSARRTRVWSHGTDLHVALAEA